MLGCDLTRNATHFRLRLRPLDAAPNPAEGVPNGNCARACPIASCPIWVSGYRLPDLGIFEGIFKPGRHDTDNARFTLVHDEFRSEHTFRTSEPALPQPVTQKNNRFSLLLLVGGEC